jgi:hypothetical protein
VRKTKSKHESAGEKLWKSRSVETPKPGFPLRLEIPQKARDSHFSHSFNNNKLDDRDHFLQNATASVASLRELIKSTPER